MRHEAINDDRHGDGREHEGAYNGRERLQPVAEREVDNGERREDASQIMMLRWCLLGGGMVAGWPLGEGLVMGLPPVGVWIPC